MISIASASMSNLGASRSSSCIMAAKGDAADGVPVVMIPVALLACRLWKEPSLKGRRHVRGDVLDSLKQLSARVRVSIEKCEAVSFASRARAV